MGKSAPKTMRFESDVEEYIEKFQGNNFSEKFHNLVRYFKDTEKQKGEVINHLDKQIKDKEKRIEELSKKLSNVGWLERSFEQLKDGIDAANNALHNVIRK